MQQYFDILKVNRNPLLERTKDLTVEEYNMIPRALIITLFGTWAIFW